MPQESPPAVDDAFARTGELSLPRQSADAVARDVNTGLYHGVATRRLALCFLLSRYDNALH
jgi:hypothetical protein